MKNNIDLTVGSVIGKVIQFALPLLLSSVIQQLYNTVDLLFAGNFLGPQYSAAIGVSSQLITCMVGFFSGIGVGTGIIASRFFGSRNNNELSKTVHNSMALAFIGGAILMVFGFLFARTYFNLVNVPDNLMDNAITYIQIYFFSIIPTLIYDMGCGILRAIGDSRSTLTAQLAGGIMNIIMDWLFIFVFGFKISGIAWATIISQLFAAAIIIIKLRKLDLAFALRFSKIRFYAATLKETLLLALQHTSSSWRQH